MSVVTQPQKQKIGLNVGKWRNIKIGKIYSETIKSGKTKTIKNAMESIVIFIDFCIFV